MVDDENHQKCEDRSRFLDHSVFWNRMKINHHGCIHDECLMICLLNREDFLIIVCLKITKIHHKNVPVWPLNTTHDGHLKYQFCFLYWMVWVALAIDILP